MLTQMEDEHHIHSTQQIHNDDDDDGEMKQHKSRHARYSKKKSDNSDIE